MCDIRTHNKQSRCSRLLTAVAIAFSESIVNSFAALISRGHKESKHLLMKQTKRYTSFTFARALDSCEIVVDLPTKFEINNNNNIKHKTLINSSYFDIASCNRSTNARCRKVNIVFRYNNNNKKQLQFTVSTCPECGELTSSSSRFVGSLFVGSLFVGVVVGVVVVVVVVGCSFELINRNSFAGDEKRTYSRIKCEL